MHAPQDTAVRLRGWPCAAILHRTNRSNVPVLYSPKGNLPGDTPGVTRYPHPESNNTLKSKAPASGVPARLRVFCLTTIYPSLPNSASSSAPASPQGLRGVVRPVGLCTEGIWKRWRRAAQTRSRAGTPEPPRSQRGQPPFPPDAGAQ